MNSKILIVTTVPDTFHSILRGQPSYLNHFFDIELACSSGSCFASVAENEKVPLHRINMQRGISPIKDALSLLGMIFLLIRVRPKLVHSYTPKAGLIAMLAAWFCRVPVRVHTFTGLIFPTEKGFKKKVLIFIDKLICACATQIVPEGNGVKGDLIHAGITRKNIKVIGFGNIAGVDLGYFSPSAALGDNCLELKRRLSIPDDAFIFCFIGRLNRDKGVGELVRAFSILSDKSYLILVGAIDEAAPIDLTTMGLINKHPRIHALGYLEDVRPVLMLSNVLVLSSYREGFPNVVLQAGAMCVPVIASNINGCNEVVEPGFNGWLVPPRQVGPLTLAMNDAMSLPAAALQDMGSAARIRIKERFEQGNHWRRMVDFYSSCLG